jgi:hypothetical protein
MSKDSMGKDVKQDKMKKPMAHEASGAMAN